MKAVKNFSDLILESIGRGRFAQFAAWLALIIGVTNLCIAPVFGALGALTAFTGVAMSAGLGDEFRAADAELGAEFDAVTSSLVGLGAVSGGLMVLAIITGICFVIIGVGLFRKMPWARMGFVIVGGIQLVISALLLLTGGDVFQLIWIVLLGFFIYVLATDVGVKQALTGKQAPAR